MLLAHKRILSGVAAPCSIIEWSPKKIKRVVRSTLATEAYSMGENAENVDHLRHVLSELFDPTYQQGTRNESASKITGVRYSRRR